MKANNVIIRSWGPKRVAPKLKNHVELVELLGIADTKKGIVLGGSFLLFKKCSFVSQ